MSLPELFVRTRRRFDPVLPATNVIAAPPGEEMFALSLPGVGHSLPFSMQQQERDEWCWAAVSVSTAKFYDDQSTWQQCQLVNDQFGLSNCCPDGGPAECDQPWFLERGLERVEHLAHKEERSVSFDEVVAEVNAGRPLGCFIVWPDGTGHFAILNGYSTDFSTSSPSEWVSVEDSKYGHTDCTYLKFLVSYQQGGEWRFTYFTQP